MNDYGFFIWTAYGVSATVIGVMALRIALDYRRLKKDLARYGAAGTREGGEA